MNQTVFSVKISDITTPQPGVFNQIQLRWIEER